ncbi:pentapeptide repeat-containing protein [Almyronema epifaneia]|uniref:Pentapeptide repeat-containing protein n=1 Tax=Almyronema epifaneia S1 TaxID=2991925 RepID=A0ABW6IC88_9CYAN
MKPQSHLMLPMGAIARWQKISAALLAATLCLGSLTVPLYAQSVSDPEEVEDIEAETQDGWEAVLRSVQLIDEFDQSVEAFVLQVEIFEKPTTTYANAVYQIYGHYQGERRLLYSNRGARLITNEAGQWVLPAEVVSITSLREEFGEFDLRDLDLEFVAQVRYDAQSRRDQRLEWRETYRYSEITRITTTEFYAVETAYEIRQLFLTYLTPATVIVIEPQSVSCALAQYPGTPAETANNRYDRAPRNDDYSHSSLRNHNFSRRNLEKAKFGRSDLSYANFYGANLTKADFKRSVLHQANLQSVYGEKAKFDAADLSCAQLAGSNFSDAKFKQADLRQADLRSAYLRKAKFKDADLRGADLRNANLSQADFKDADLRGADLRGANLHDAKLRDARLEGALLPEGFSTRRRR